MKNYFLILVYLFLVLFTTNSFAFDPPKPNGYIMDLAGKLTTEQVQQLNSKLESINKNTKNEFAALIIPSLNGDSIEDVAHTTFNTWKVGKVGLDNGVLVVIAVADRKSRIEVGKGVEGDLTDLQSNDILRKTLAPCLRQGDFYGGLNSTFDSISSTIESRKTASTTAKVAKPLVSGVAITLVLLFCFIGIPGLVILIMAIFYWIGSKKDNEEVIIRKTVYYPPVSTYTPGSKYSSSTPISYKKKSSSLYSSPNSNSNSDSDYSNSRFESDSDSDSDSSSSSSSWSDFGGGSSGGGGSSDSW